MSNDVFISYSRRDLDFVTKLHKYLGDKGISAWFDQTSIEIGDQWRKTIVDGITGCKLFLVVLSPDSARSKNVRKEIDLAERNEKKILPLIWRGDSDTVISSEIAYQLAGINYIDFKENASEENLNKIANTVNKLLGGATISEAASNEPVVETKAVSAQPAQTTIDTSSRGLRRERRRKKKQQFSAVDTLGAVMARVVTPLSADVEDDEVNDDINNELEWLFAAADHFLRIRNGDVDRNARVPVDVPESAEASDEARTRNSVLASVQDFSFQMMESQVESIIKQINIYLKNLTFELDKEAKWGGSDAVPVVLKNSIEAQRKSIVERMQEMAPLMNKIYGVMVFGPDDLADELE